MRKEEYENNDTYPFRNGKLFHAKVGRNHLSPTSTSRDGLQVVNYVRSEKGAGAFEFERPHRWRYPPRITTTSGERARLLSKLISVVGGLISSVGRLIGGFGTGRLIGGVGGPAGVIGDRSDHTHRRRR